MTSVRDPEDRLWPNEIARTHFENGDRRWVDWASLDTETAIRTAQRLARLGATQRSVDTALPPRFLTSVASAVALWDIPERTTATGRHWRLLVDVVIKRPASLGIVRTGPGGLKTLHKREFGRAWPWSTFTANIARWAATGPSLPLVRVRYGDGGRRFKPATSIEIPLLTEILIWAARHRMEPKRYHQLETVGLQEADLDVLAVAAARRQAWPPLDIEYPREWGDGWGRGPQPSPRKRAQAYLGSDKTPPTRLLVPVRFERLPDPKSD